METLSTTRNQSWLIWFFRGLLLLGFFILTARLFELQIIKGSYFRQLAEGNRVRKIPIVAPRGRIIARGGETLVGNKKVKKKIVLGKDGYEKQNITDDINEEDVFSEWQRNYEFGERLAHVTGYLGEVTKEELGKVRVECPQKGTRKLGELIGKSGLEKEYDCLLAGVDGEELIEVDAQGKKVRILGRKDAVAGADLKTTIDLKLQEKVFEIFNQAQIPEGKRGVVVVSDIKGEILAFYSSPSYDPNAFISKERSYLVESYFQNKDLPLFNRVISGKYHPGSIFKPIVAIAALEEGKINKDFTYEDKGVIFIDTAYGKFSFSNWYFNQYGRTEGLIRLPRAIARSTDTFFYNLGEMVGVEKLVFWSEKFGLDKRTGIDIPGEVGGLIPSPAWKSKTKKERWFLGNTYHMSIGQGDIALTPIGINAAISSIASGGKLCTPHLFAGELQSKTFRSSISNPRCKELGISMENINLVKEGMRQACSPGGTGFTFFDFKEKMGIDVACKTGTAEVEDGKNPHAWFTVFAPVDNPEIVATILVENGGEGSKVAGPIARKIFDYWFGRGLDN